MGNKKVLVRDETRVGHISDLSVALYNALAEMGGLPLQFVSYPEGELGGDVALFLTNYGSTEDIRMETLRLVAEAGQLRVAVLVVTAAPEQARQFLPRELVVKVGDAPGLLRKIQELLEEK